MKKSILAAVLAAAVVFGCQVQQKSGSGETSGLELFQTDKGGKVIAEFDGIKITDNYLKTYIDQLNPYIKARYNTPEKKEELITRILEGEVLARAAIKKGAVNDPVLLTKIKSTIARYYTGKALKTEIEEKIKVSDAEMKKYFEENKKKYNQPEKVKASHILVKVAEKAPKADWTKAEAKAKKILKEVKAKAKDPKAFSNFVKKYSDDTGSKRRGGDVGYFARTEEGGSMVKEFSDAAFSLKKVGDISALVKSNFGYHIIKLSGRRDKVEKAFIDVRARIESTMKAEKRKDAYKNSIEDIKKSMNYKFYKDQIAAIDMKVPESAKGGSKGPGKKPGRGAMPKLDKKALQETIKHMKKNPGVQKKMKSKK